MKRLPLFTSGAPELEGVEDVVGGIGFGREGVIQEAFEVPTEFLHERLGMAGDFRFIGRLDRDGREGFAVGIAGEFEGWRGGVGDVLDG